MDVDGDTFLWKEIESLVKKNNVQLIIETGTYLGNTAKKFSTLTNVLTCEINKDYYLKAVENIGEIKNIKSFLGNSVDILRENKRLLEGLNLLFFLDAHWYDYCPLMDELNLISELGLKPIIVIHDFKVPGKDFGYDSYNGKAFDYELIEKSVELIYGKNGFEYYYNKDSDGPCRGAVFILSKKGKK